MAIHHLIMESENVSETLVFNSTLLLLLLLTANGISTGGSGTTI
jgi:hypothetical protein